MIADASLPPELLREVAARLKSLARVMPYDDYAAIVYRIARLRRRCEHGYDSSGPCVTQSSSSDRDVSDEIAADDAQTRMWCAAMAYSRYVALTSRHESLIDQARQAQAQASKTRAAIAHDRAERSRDVEARARFREAMREYVTRLKAHGSSLDSVLQSAGQLIRRLRTSGEAPDVRGTLEEEVPRVAAEEYCAAA